MNQAMTVDGQRLWAQLVRHNQQNVGPIARHIVIPALSLATLHYLLTDCNQIGQPGQQDQASSSRPPFEHPFHFQRNFVRTVVLRSEIAQRTNLTPASVSRITITTRGWSATCPSGASNRAGILSVLMKLQ